MVGIVSLFNQAKRLERQRFFWRLDAQWGKGFHQKTGSDLSPNRSYNPAEPKVLETVTKLPRTHLVNPACENGSLYLGDIKARIESDRADKRHGLQNSGLHFVRGINPDFVPSPCTARMSNTVDYTALGLPWPMPEELTK